jgi:light-regulated signal transduction histidine kinase (bacteriophytochrome)
MSEPAKPDQRAVRLLRNLHKVFNHDLPNQLVVVHGLLQLLKMDDKSRLTAEAQEYLNRSEAACKRVLQMLDVVKKITQVESMPLARETLAVSEFLRELLAAAKQMFNGLPLETMPSSVATFTAPRAALQQALLNLLAALPRASAAGTVYVGVAATASGVEFRIGPQPGAAVKPLVVEATRGIADRLALMYVQELVEAWGGSLKGNLEASCFVVDVPHSP